MSPDLRRFTKPEGFDKRMSLRGEPHAGAAIAEPQSLLSARARAVQQNIPLDQLLAAERSRLRESNYPGPDCFEPYEVEDHLAGRLTAERASHADACEGCRMLLSGASVPNEPLAEFLAAIEEAELNPNPERAREFRLEFVGTAAAFVAVVGLANVAFRFSPAAADPSTQAALVAQLRQIAPPALMTAIWIISLVTLLALWIRNAPELLIHARGALAAGGVVGIIVALVGWQNVTGLASTMRTAVAFAQEQLTEAMAAAGGPPYVAAETTTPFQLMTPSSFITVTATHDNGQPRVYSSTEGLPGSVVAEVQPSGGNVYWEVANQKEPLGYILYGTVENAQSADFVLVDPTQREHVIRKPAGAPEVTKGSEVMVLMTPANKAVSVHPVAQTSGKR